MNELVLILGLLSSSPEAQRVLRPYALVSRIDPPLEEGMPEQRSLTSKQDGLELQLDPQGSIKTIFLYGATWSQFKPFRGALWPGLSFSSTREDVERALGAPTRSAGSGSTLLGPHGGWVRYDRADYSVHISFSADSRHIDLVTLMTPDSVPR